MDYTQAIADAAASNNVDPTLAIEVAAAESGFNPNAVSSAGAIGIMQLMPGTAAMYGVDPTDPLENIDGGTAYLGDLLNQFDGNTAAALAAYNWGPGRVQAAMATYGASWLAHAPSETQAYVAKILGNVATQYQVQAPFALPPASAQTLPLPSPALPSLPVFPSAGLATLQPANSATLPSNDTLIILAVIGGVIILAYTF